MIVDLKVGITLPDGEYLIAGRLMSRPEGRGFISGFQYHNDYLAHPRAFALDPHELPLGVRVIETSPTSAPIIFEDALPDDWGRRLLSRFHNLPLQKQYPAALLQYMGKRSMGALSFGDGQYQVPLPLTGEATLADLAAAVEKFDRDETSMAPGSAELAKLYQAGASPGGGRPKALVQYQDRPHLAKFPSKKDEFDMVRLEAASMALGRMAGLEPPPSTVEIIGDRPVFLVERFDVTQGAGRRHLVSFRTLLQVSGFPHTSYKQLFGVLRELTSKPAQDIPRLYRWTIFNVLFGNTDDHLQNFSMCHDDDGWHLSPAYDLLPDTEGRVEHVQAINASNYPPGRKELLQFGKEIGLSPQSSISQFDKVHTAVSQWREVFDRYGVPGEDIDRLERDISTRLGKA